MKWYSLCNMFECKQFSLPSKVEGETWLRGWMKGTWILANTYFWAKQIWLIGVRSNTQLRAKVTFLQGFSVGSDKNYWFIARARKYPISFDRCPFFIRYVHFDIQFAKISIILSNYPSLKALKVYNQGNMKKTLKIND